MTFSEKDCPNTSFCHWYNKMIVLPYIYTIYTVILRFYWFTWMISIYANRKLSPAIDLFQSHSTLFLDN